jgi:hypothetical protein
MNLKDNLIETANEHLFSQVVAEGMGVDVDE